MFRTGVTGTAAALVFAATLAAGCSAPGEGPQEEPGGQTARAEGTPPPESSPAESPAQLRQRVEQVTSDQPITFEPESAQVTPHGQETIVVLSDILSSAPKGVRVEIVGYAEPGLGGGKKAEELSARRAEVVAEQLAQQGAPPKMLHPRGGGVAPPDSGDARRVDVRVR